jgi:Subtilisin inhibitor-like
MRRRTACIAPLLAALVWAGPGLAVPTALRITFWPAGKSGASQAWTLRCAPAGGSLPQAARACTRLAAIAHPFAPVPGGVACSQIYGGPQLALVTGSFQATRVWTYFKRTDGCQTARWNRVGFLFPSG